MRFFGKTTLGKKLLAFYLVIVAVSFYFMLAFGQTYIYDQVLGDSKEALLSAAQTMLNGHFNEGYYTSETILTLRGLYETAAEVSNSRVLIIQNDGDILIDTDTASHHNSNEDKNPSTVQNIYQTGSISFLRHTTTYDLKIPGLITSPSLCVCLPMQKSGYFNGYLVFTQENTYIQNRAGYFNNILFTVYFIILGLLLLTYIGIYIFCFLPLRKLRNASKDFAIGHDNEHITIRSHDEYGELADTLNVIGDELKKFDEYQRKFLSNISHDFRSPLTNIHGYIQAMTDGVIPYDESVHYLQIILAETERLTHMTDEIVELTSYNRDSVFLDIQSFDIHEVIADCTDVLESAAAKKSVLIQTNLYTAKENNALYVNADRQKIHQVLYNLLDNAIKFSKDDTTIYIQTLLKKDTVMVSVKDNGIGIPKDDIPKIWDRFYKSDLSRGKNKNGSGLGLSICKEIIKAHKQTIDVVSTEGVGTTFTFTLPHSAM